MARIRYVQIRNFRSIKSLDWTPGPGINCLIGPGDAGKSTVLDAIEACLSPRRVITFADTDFYGLDITQPIEITVTLGELSDELKDIDLYGDYLRGFDEVVDVVDEPHSSLETVLSLQLKVDADLDPTWRLYSDRTAAMDPVRNLPWKARLELSPIR
ncbi:MAG TPA: AAA family ATPase, partial [Solimonas sp.]